MRNLTITFMLILLLLLNPVHYGESISNTKVKSIEELKRIFIELNKKNILHNINKQYSSYNLKLNTYDNRISKKDNKINIDFINSITCNALESEGLPSISIAQAILETGYGRSNKLKSNIFGIKGRGIKSKTKEFVNGKYITIKAEFQKITNLNHAFNRHYEIISRYGFDNRNYKDWAFKIKKCGYATDPKYAEKLIYLIEKHDLARLDSIQELNKSLNNYNNLINGRLSDV